MPCIRTTGIDCFKEGEYDFDMPGGLPETLTVLDGAIAAFGSTVNISEQFADYNIDIDTFKRRTSFADPATTEEQIRVAAAGPCTGLGAARRDGVARTTHMGRRQNEWQRRHRDCQSFSKYLADRFVRYDCVAQQNIAR